MSRSLGGRSLTTAPPIEISPSVISSRPAIIRQGRALAAARGADQNDEFVVGDVEIDAGDSNAHRRTSSPHSAALRQPYANPLDVVLQPLVAPAVRPAM